MNPCQEDLKMESEKFFFCGDWNPLNPVHLSMPGVAIGNFECAIGTEVGFVQTYGNKGSSKRNTFSYK